MSAPADRALQAALQLMAPVVRWLLRHGIQYGAFSLALKRVFVEVAQQELQRSGAKQTDSALSVLSGVHRKDVRQLRDHDPSSPGHALLSPASKLFTRWLGDRRFRDAAGRPRALPRTGAVRSFESLAREISTDVHPRTLLEELVRRGLVHVADDRIEPDAEAFIPAGDAGEMLELFAANAHDHLAAAVQNLTTDEPRQLEQSVYAYGLSERSVEELGAIARVLWAEAFQRMVTEATLRYESDAGTAAPWRMRFGSYFHHEPERAEPDGGPPP